MEANKSNELVPSSQGSPMVSNGTQRLHLELDDEDTENPQETQLDNQSPPRNLPELGISPSELRPEKRVADDVVSASDIDMPSKIAKLEKSAEVDEEDIFSDVEILNDNSKTSQSIEVVTLGDSLVESTETFSGPKEDAAEPEVKKEDDEERSGQLEEYSNSIEGGSSEAVTDNATNAMEASPDLVQVDEPPHHSNGIVTSSSQDEDAKEEQGPSPANSMLIEEPLRDSPAIDLSNGPQTSTPERSSLASKSNSMPSSTSEEAKEFHDNDTLRITSSPEEESTFKSPNESGGYVVALLEKAVFEKIVKQHKVENHFNVKNSFSNPNKHFKEIQCFMQKNQDHRRLSDVSALSGGSSGYHADTSSTGSSSTGSKRDRLSIMPETLIQPHKVLSPLPKRLYKEPPKVVVEEVPKMKPNIQVFAKWVERTNVKFWPGVIKEDVDENNYLILFDDGYEKTVKKTDVIRADALLPGCQVNVEKEEGVFQVGVILAYPDCSTGISDVFYTVQLEGLPNLPETEAEPVSYKKIHLTVTQWKEIHKQRGTNLSLSDISLDNLQTGKRKSKQVTPLKLKRKFVKKGGENIETSNHEDDDVSSEVKSSDEEIKKTPRRTRRALFRNMCFLLTQGTAKEKEALDMGESAMESETEDEEDILEEPKFNRKELKKKIVDNGGKVLEKFPGEKEKIPEKVIVLSDRACKTMTYLLSVAYGFERINFLWVHNSVTERELLPRQNYALQIGFSSHLNRDVENSEIKKNRRDLFKGIHILIATTEKSFFEDWKPVLTRLGAAVSMRSKGKIDRSLKAVDLVIGDSNRPSSICKDALDKDLFVVSTEWIVQCLIVGERLAYGDFLLT